MKRYGKKEVLNYLKEEWTQIRFYDYVMTNHGGYKVLDTEDNIIGYITYDLFYDLLKNGYIIRVSRGWACESYEYNYMRG